MVARRPQSKRPRKAPVPINTINEKFLVANGVKPKTPLFARLKRNLPGHIKKAAPYVAGLALVAGGLYAAKRALPNSRTGVQKLFGTKRSYINNLRALTKKGTNKIQALGPVKGNLGNKIQGIAGTFLPKENA